VSPRLRVALAVAAAAAAAAGITVGVTLATRDDVHRRRVEAPPLVADATATRPVRLAVREALRAWPNGTVRRLHALSVRYPESALVRLELGLSLAFSGSSSEAAQAFRAAKRVQPDSPSAVRADDALHPDTPPGKPPFVASFTRPRTPVERLLARGIRFQAALRPLSAERAFAAAARRSPGNAEAQVAAAVGLYDKDRPAAAFSRLGPLARRFPQAQSVRFHLGLLLLYLGQIVEARHQLAQAVALGRRTPLGRQARTLLEAADRGRDLRSRAGRTPGFSASSR
jgi:tetratricopeptide (TPR) repeat protein